MSVTPHAYLPLQAGQVLDGRALAQAIESALAPRVQAIAERHGRTPALATILVGDDPASATYVAMKARACERVGMLSVRIALAQETSTETLLAEIDRLNADPAVDGVLLQHPVPSQIDERAAFDRIAPHKDVDGVGSAGFGALSMGLPAYAAATPAGIMRLLAHYGIPIAGRHAVVVGRSAILGKPMAMMLLNADATVSICHSRTPDLAEHVGRADILVAALGRPRFIRKEWIRAGAVVVDAGYHPGAVGDVELDDAPTRCSAWTPVPGGVGPMTIALLIEQTVAAAERHTNAVV